MATLSGDRMKTYWEMQRVIGGHDIIYLCFIFKTNFPHKHGVVLIPVNSIYQNILAPQKCKLSSAISEAVFVNLKKRLPFINQTEGNMWDLLVS